MPGKIPLPVANNVQPPDHPPTLYRLLPNSGADGLSSPSDVMRKTNID
jgi:hypothetical protein